jgi:hypothetical protein
MGTPQLASHCQEPAATHASEPQTPCFAILQREIIKIRLRSMRKIPNKLYEQSMKQKVGF